MTKSAQHTTGSVDVTFGRARAPLNALNDWENRSRSGMRQRLEQIRNFLNRLGNPHARRRCGANSKTVEVVLDGVHLPFILRPSYAI